MHKVKGESVAGEYSEITKIGGTLDLRQLIIW